MILLNLTAIIIITPTRPLPPMLTKLIMGSNFSDVYSNYAKTNTTTEVHKDKDWDRDSNRGKKWRREKKEQSKKCIWSDSFTWTLFHAFKMLIRGFRQSCATTSGLRFLFDSVSFQIKISLSAFVCFPFTVITSVFYSLFLFHSICTRFLENVRRMVFMTMITTQVRSDRRKVSSKAEEKHLNHYIQRIFHSQPERKRKRKRENDKKIASNWKLRKLNSNSSSSDSITLCKMWITE